MRASLIVRLRALLYALTLTRFNLFILLSGLVLLLVDQGQDLLRALIEDDAWLPLLGGGLLWGWSIWYWARLLLDIRFPDPPVAPGELAWWRAHLPRILGMAAFLVLAWSLYQASLAQPRGGFHAAVVALGGVGFFLAVLYRRPLAQWLARRLRPENPQASVWWLDDLDAARGEAGPARWQDDLRGVWGHGPWGRWPVRLSVGLGLLLFVWGMLWPLRMGEVFNALVLLFLWGAGFLPAGSLITYVGSRRGYPLFTGLILLALVFSHVNDNHRIRPLGAALPRPQIDAALAQWTARHCQGSACPPLLIVATAGGGIRAAYWTGTVLGHLDDRLARQQGPALREHLFAISGVSGGSVGATVYRAALDAGVGQGQMMESVQDVLARNYLTPLAAGLLYRDFVQRFLPWDALPDRATTFEQGLEAGFQQALGRPALEASFSALSQGRTPGPALFLNSTWSENGRRIVAAGYHIPVEQRLYADLIEGLGYDLRLSTAAHNSARFPFASPPGSWALQPGGGGDPILQRLQDGGLFENYGAETALEILRAAERHFAAHALDFQPLVILISSDPGLPPDLRRPQINPPLAFGYEVLTTFSTYAATRVGRGAEAAVRLQQVAEGLPGGSTPARARFVHFRMCDGDGGPNPPLGWALSQAAQARIRAYLLDAPAPAPEPPPPCRPDNQAALGQVLTALGGG